MWALTSCSRTIKVFVFVVRRAHRHEIYGLARFPQFIRRTCGNYLADDGGQQIGDVLPSRSGRDTRTLIDEIKRVSVIGGDAVEPLTLLEASLVMAGRPIWIELDRHDWKASTKQCSRLVGPAQQMAPTPPAVGASEALDRHWQV